jgi:LysM repeat protein
MVLRRVALLSLLLLTLAGCYRQADEGFQPVTVPTDGDGQNTPSIAITTMPPTNTIEPVSVITDEPLPFDTPVDTSGEPTNTPPLVITIAPTETDVMVVEPTNTQDTSTFITPGSPQGPVVIETNTPAVVVDATSTPSGLITPTQFSIGGSIDEEACEYTVQRGDTLYTIALAHEIFLRDLRTANPQVRGDLIRAGDVLKIPGCGEEPEPTATATQEETVEGGVIHIVQRGESLYTIALRYGVTVQQIINANNLTNPNRIDIGQRLIIPVED